MVIDFCPSFSWGIAFFSFSLKLIVNDKSQNLRRLQAQRNELNAKGKLGIVLWIDFVIKK